MLICQQLIPLFLDQIIPFLLLVEFKLFCVSNDVKGGYFLTDDLIC
jgi:hypothetical protein